MSHKRKLLWLPHLRNRLCISYLFRFKYRKLMYECPYREYLVIRVRGKELESAYCRIRGGHCGIKNPWECPEFLDMDK